MLISRWRLRIWGAIGLLIAVVLASPVAAQFEVNPPATFADGPTLAPRSVEPPAINPAQLHPQGLRGLRNVLDELLPDTAGPKELSVPVEAVQTLVVQLGDDRYGARETAMRKLVALGEGAKPQLLAATKNRNAEISWRAVRVLRLWDQQQFEDKSASLPNFARYCSEIHDDERLAELAQRTQAAFRNGLWTESRVGVLKQCVMVLLRTGNDEYVNLMKALLRHPDMEAGTLILDAARQCAAEAQGLPEARRAAAGCASLLIDAMRGNREELATVAISYAADADVFPPERIRAALLEIFNNNAGELKFQAAFPLMTTFRYAPAHDYLLQQARADDQNRRYLALSWLQSRPPGQAPDAQLLATLVPLAMKHEDSSTRLTATVTLASYSSETVIRDLIEILADQDDSVNAAAVQGLLQQADRKLARGLLEKANRDHALKGVRQSAKAVLEQMEQAEEADLMDVDPVRPSAPGIGSGPTLNWPMPLPLSAVPLPLPAPPAAPQG